MGKNWNKKCELFEVSENRRCSCDERNPIIFHSAWKSPIHSVRHCCHFSSSSIDATRSETIKIQLLRKFLCLLSGIIFFFRGDKNKIVDFLSTFSSSLSQAFCCFLQKAKKSSLRLLRIGAITDTEVLIEAHAKFSLFFRSSLFSSEPIKSRLILFERGALQLSTTTTSKSEQTKTRFKLCANRYAYSVRKISFICLTCFSMASRKTLDVDTISSILIFCVCKKKLMQWNWNRILVHRANIKNSVIWYSERVNASNTHV